MSARAKKTTKVGQEQCIDPIPYYLSGLSRALFSDNLSRNSCITTGKTVGRYGYLAKGSTKYSIELLTTLKLCY